MNKIVLIAELKGKIAMNEDLVYFELNNWMGGDDYPTTEPFCTWVEDLQITDEWCKKNKLVAKVGTIDMSVNWCITTTRQWVEENCPDLLSDNSFDIVFLRTIRDEKTNTIVEKEFVSTYYYKDFLRFPEEDGNVYGRFGWKFEEYKPENFGVSYVPDDDEE